MMLTKRSVSMRLVAGSHHHRRAPESSPESAGGGPSSSGSESGGARRRSNQCRHSNSKSARSRPKHILRADQFSSATTTASVHDEKARGEEIDDDDDDEEIGGDDVVDDTLRDDPLTGTVTAPSPYDVADASTEMGTSLLEEGAPTAAGRPGRTLACGHLEASTSAASNDLSSSRTPEHGLRTGSAQGADEPRKLATASKSRRSTTAGADAGAAAGNAAVVAADSRIPAAERSTTQTSTATPPRRLIRYGHTENALVFVTLASKLFGSAGDATSAAVSSALRLFIEHSGNNNSKQAHGPSNVSKSALASVIGHGVRCRYPCYVLGLQYLRRLQLEVCGGELLPLQAMPRLLCTVAVVGVKFYDDLYYTNEHYANAFRWHLELMNILESELLRLLRFRLRPDRAFFDLGLKEFNSTRSEIGAAPSRGSSVKQGGGIDSVNSSVSTVTETPRGAAAGPSASTSPMQLTEEEVALVTAVNTLSFDQFCQIVPDLTIQEEVKAILKHREHEEGLLYEFEQEKLCKRALYTKSQSLNSLLVQARSIVQPAPAPPPPTNTGLLGGPVVPRAARQHQLAVNHSHGHELYANARAHQHHRLGGGVLREAGNTTNSRTTTMYNNLRYSH